jgi:hypothetical protein
MNPRRFGCCAALFIAALPLFCSAKAAEPASAATKPAGVYVSPRTSFGDPDLQGLWTNASLTALERPTTISNTVVSPEQAAVIERAINSRIAADRQPSNPGAGALQAGGEVRGYNSFWLDRGSKLARVNGEIRTAWVVDPPNGRVPYTAEGLRALRAAAAKRSFNDPEARSLGERCIIGYGSTGGPPMLNVLYNNHYQIVQSPGFVTIVVEMNHDARIIRLGGSHPPQNIRYWMGDSIGHWEGDTLVVETTNLHPAQAYIAGVRNRLYLAPDAKVIERFTRVAADEILYQFAVEDANAYTQTWRGELPLRTAPGPMYEYACHEGNRSLEGILRGARYEEKQRGGAK